MSSDWTPEAPQTKVPWRIGDALLILVLFFLVIGGLSAVIQLRPFGTRPIADIAAMTFGYLFLLFLIWYFAINRRRGRWTDLGMRSFSVGRSILWAVGWLIVLRVATVIYLLIVTGLGLEPSNEWVTRLPEVFGSGLSGLIAAIAVAALLAPVIEELFFRGFFYSALRARIGVWPAILASGVLFALVHFNLWLFVPVALIGVILAYLYERTGSLGPPIVLHALNNLSSILALYLVGATGRPIAEHMAILRALQYTRLWW